MVGKVYFFMETEKRRSFIIHFIYIAILLGLVLFAVKYALPMVAPFVLAFLIASLLKRPIRFISAKTHLRKKPTAILAVLLFYSTIGILITLASVKLFTVSKALFLSLPSFYNTHVQPYLMSLADNLEQSILRMDPSLIAALNDLLTQFIMSLGEMVSSLSMGVVGIISSYASSLPGLLVKILLMVICSFFITADYDTITGFCLRQIPKKGQALLLHIRDYVVGTLFGCIRSYALIMALTFVELSIGLWIIGVENSFLIALLIAVFDILPVLGTGGIMIPWTIITALQGNFRMAICLLVVYLVVTVIRNILEPKIVGSQVGLHPVVTLISLFVGAQLFGILGLFGLPITVSLLKHLSDTGEIRLFR